MNERFAPALCLPLLISCLAAGCSSSPESGDGESRGATSIETVVDGLNNPASVSFDSTGRLTICDAGPGRDHGNGRVLLWSNGATEEYITAFPTQYWKPGKDGAPDRFKLGPLSAVWADAETLVVSNGGLADGVDNLQFFRGGGTAAGGLATNAIPPTTDGAKDNGEGNFAGLSMSEDGAYVYACGQGADARSWLVRCEVATRDLTAFASADENGIEINSPMQSMAWGDDSILVLYSGAGGVQDGLLVRWSLSTKTPTGKWTLPGLADPMGMARVPGTDELMVVDNNWSLTEVKMGRLARVTLPDLTATAVVTLVREDLAGPTSCSFGPDGKLYIALLGPAFDSDAGSVVAVSGLH